MASINPTFEQTLAKFKSRLTKKELENFEFSSLNDVQMILLKIQEEQNRQKGMMNLARIQRFLEAMEQYGQVIEVFLNASSILCFVWGPMKFCLQVSNTFPGSVLMITATRLPVLGPIHLISFLMHISSLLKTFLSYNNTMSSSKTTHRC